MNNYELLRTIKTIQTYLDNGDKHDRIDIDLKEDIECELSYLAYCIVTNTDWNKLLEDE